MYTVKAVDIDEIRNSRDRWNNLVLSMKRPSIFCTWEWIYTWWEHFGYLYDPLIFFIYKNTELVGIFPLAARNMIVEDAILPSRVLSFCGSKELHSDHTDIICKESNAPFCINAVIDFLMSEYRQWDMLHLSHFPEDSNFLNLLNTTKTNLERDCMQVSSASYITLKDNFEDYNRSLSKNLRDNLKRTRKKLYNELVINHTCFTPDNYPNSIQELFMLHKLRADEKKIKTSFQGEQLMKFHEKVSKLLYEKGWVRLCFLRKGEKAIAADYGFIFGRRFFAYQTAILPDREFARAGNVLLHEVIEEAFRDKLIEFDFLRGGEEYKGSWARESRALFNINLYNKSFRGTLLKHAYRARNQVKKVFNNFRNKSKKTV
jgi:hypothetical protein